MSYFKKKLYFCKLEIMQLNDGVTGPAHSGG